MEVCEIPAGPKIVHILHALFEEVLGDPKLNTTDYLERRSIELCALPEKDLQEKGRHGREKKEEVQEKTIEEIKKKHHVS
jgi:hypothetical protein